MTIPKLTFSNPRLAASFSDWPMGGSRRGNCKFAVEHNPKRGYRISRTTAGHNPKITTFGGKVAIVDGSDGKTYIVQHAGQFEFINVWRSDFMSEGAQFPKNSDASLPTFEELSSLIEQANR